jgi:tetratricopeptide (TPR) repeat protein
MSAVAWVACALLAGAPADDSRQRARALFLRGNEHVRAQAYDAALADYRAAYALFRSPKILLNTGTMLQLLGRTADAANTYATYLEDPDADPARIEEVRALVGELDREVVRLRIVADPQPAEISVDGVLAGVAAPVLTRRIEPGAHAVEARFEDSRSALVELTNTAGETRDVQLRLPRPLPPADLACEPSLTPPMPAWVSAAVSLLAVGAGVYFGNRVRDDSVAYDEARTLARRANVAYGVAAVGAAMAGGSWVLASQSGCGSSE